MTVNPGHLRSHCLGPDGPVRPPTAPGLAQDVVGEYQLRPGRRRADLRPHDRGLASPLQSGEPWEVWLRQSGPVEMISWSCSQARANGARSCRGRASLPTVNLWSALLPGGRVAGPQLCRRRWPASCHGRAIFDACLITNGHTTNASSGGFNLASHRGPGICWRDARRWGAGCPTVATNRHHGSTPFRCRSSSRATQGHSTDTDRYGAHAPHKRWMSGSGR